MKKKKTTLGNKIQIVKMLQNKEQRSAIEQLVKDEIIQNFLEKNMTRLIEKGLSTQEEDTQELDSLMEQFQPAIMAIGTIEHVKQKIDDKIEQMNPGSQVSSPSPEKATSTEQNRINN